MFLEFGAWKVVTVTLNLSINPRSISITVSMKHSHHEEEWNQRRVEKRKEELQEAASDSKQRKLSFARTGKSHTEVRLHQSFIDNLNNS